MIKNNNKLSPREFEGKSLSLLLGGLSQSKSRKICIPKIFSDNLQINSIQHATFYCLLSALFTSI